MIRNRWYVIACNWLCSSIPVTRGIWTSAIKQEVWRTFGDAKKSIADEKASIVNLLPA